MTSGVNANKIISKWVFIIFLFLSGLGGIAIGLQGYFQKYPNINELRLVSGWLVNYSIVDVDAGRFSNHKITMHLEGVQPPIVFKYVDYFPAMKQTLKHTRTVEVWVEPNDYEVSKIWQLRLDSKMIVPLDEYVQECRNRSKDLIWHIGLPLLIAGTILWLMIASKNPFLNKLYGYIISLLVIGGLIFTVLRLVSKIGRL